jgi:cytochrome c-type biogenesis protein CcsB
MEKVINFLFSMKMMTLGLLIFFVAIGAATIIESIYNIQAAKLFIYNAIWFEILLTFLGFNLIANIFRSKMYKPEKIASFMFHLAFIVILIGSGVTRFFSFEGMMLIREGESSDVIYTADPHVKVFINDGKMQYKYDRTHFMSTVEPNFFNKLLGSNYFSLDIDFPGRKNEITVEYVKFESKMVDTLTIGKDIKGTVLDIVTDGKKSNYLAQNNFMFVGDIPISFDKNDAAQGVNIKLINGEIKLRTDLPMRYLPMSEMQKVRQSGGEVSDSMYVEVPVGEWVPFKTTTLYLVNGQQFVFKQAYENAEMRRVSSGKKNVGTDYLTLKVTDGKDSKLVTLSGGKDVIANKEMFVFKGLTYEMQYGSTAIMLPFSLMCMDFRLNRYPGSNMPSSFESDVRLMDPKNKVEKDYMIYMNTVMDYNGYRFFQSSYDSDEKGTRLSVNHDWWGTNISYLGYLMMAIGMIMSLFARDGRFKELNTKLKKTKERRLALSKIIAFIGIFVSMNFQSMAQEHNHEDHAGHEHHGEGAHSKPKEVEADFKIMSKEHSDKMSSLLVQEFGGRISPLHTLCDNLLRDILDKSTYNGNNAVQTVMSMHMYPEHWMGEKIIAISANLRDTLGVEKLASFKDLTDEKGNFKLINEYNIAFQKAESKRNEFDKKLIKLADNFQVVQGIFIWQYMKIIPVKGELNNKWFVPLSKELMDLDSASSYLALRYLNSLDKSCKSNSYGETDDMLAGLKKFQRDLGEEIVPSESVVNMEISYNKMHIFSNSLYLYLTLGFLLLILYFVRIFKGVSERSLKIFSRITLAFTVLIGITFVYHAAGLVMRWQITGHAPWSNGYEAVVFIAWITVLAGFIFIKKNPVILASTAILASLMILVTEMSLMDPQMTPLQPVLKSYWLMIHVSVITSSYGFLGLACILGLLNLILFTTRNKKNGELVSCHITELTYVSELTMTVGVFALTIGNFLGAIWANESWGRYWGWDPKEVWALVSILVYAIILHLRYIPGLKSKFVFSVVSFWGYASILFTFFGVNFYLVGLHSYAQGEGLGKIPNSILITIGLFILFTIFASIRNKKYKKLIKEDNDI